MLALMSNSYNSQRELYHMMGVVRALVGTGLSGVQAEEGIGGLDVK